MTEYFLAISDFQKLRPKYESSQESCLQWLAKAHAKSSGDFDAMKARLDKVGCKPGIINTRGHELEDFTHFDWDKMEIYALNEEPRGVNLTKRLAFFEEKVDRAFEIFYPDEAIAPQNLIHVSCTGYVAPSGAQKIVSKRGWGKTTTVTHAYHMGCYGAISALRIAMGFGHNVDIVHSELCTLHLNPARHENHEFVAQSLFADGYMKYTLSKEGNAPGLTILGIHEEIIPNTEGEMFWKIADWGYEMFLSREIPVHIAKALESYLTHLIDKVGIPGEKIMKHAQFAVHPGGPKILDYIEKILKLEKWQLEKSRAVLRNYGNMSSATLPHIWELMLDDPGGYVVSLAFGPGLTICGAIMEKK